MVLLSEVQASNSRIASTLPGLVAVFVGATNGIGEATIKSFAKFAKEPRVYFTGRSEEAGNRIKAECSALNPAGSFTFIKADTSLIANVDHVCRTISRAEPAINILFLSTGTLALFTKSSEGLHTAVALAHHTRARFIENLLPNIQAATSLKRVVSCFAGTKEGVMDENDFQGWNAKVSSPIAARGALASLVTVYLEAIAKRAPDVSFVHDFPGAVKSGIARDTTGVKWGVIKALSKVLGPFVYISPVECGDRHVFLATSARYPASVAAEAKGVELTEGVSVAKGTDGKSASGVYTVEEKCESQGAKVEELLAKYRVEGMPEKVWEHTQGEFRRILFDMGWERHRDSD